MKFKLPKFIPVVFHNLSKYDAHLFVCQLVEVFSHQNVSCIAENMEKYISFDVGVQRPLLDEKSGKQLYKKNKDGTPKTYPSGDIMYKWKRCRLRFIDSIRFMASSLDSLAKNLTDEDLKTVIRYYPDEEKRDLLKRKGVFPYEYMDSWARLEEMELPPKEAFFSKLNMSGISDDDYKHAQNVWKTFKCKTLKDYHDFWWYMKTDVMLLADVFETFRDTCMKHYGLDPAHFYTAPGLAWMAALKLTGVELRLFDEIDMILFVERGIRGGISQAIHRYAEANNKYMGDRYDVKKLSSFLQYLDANNLYGWGMSEKLPTHDFRWCDEMLTEADILSYKNGDIGYILEIDIDYPEELHDLHNDLPFFAEKKKIGKVEKLTPNLFDKKNYVVHIRTLKQGLEHGLKLSKVHKVLQFQQRAWLKPYIDLNTRLRMASNNDFEKDFFKLMNNSVFGKTMENVRIRKDIKLVNNLRRKNDLIRKPNYAGITKFTENFVGIEMKKVEVYMNKHIVTGLAVLDLSKTVMYEFHYDYMIPKYGCENVKLCYTDTDSFIYHIKTDDFYADIAGKDTHERFDTSGYGLGTVRRKL